MGLSLGYGNKDTQVNINKTRGNPKNNRKLENPATNGF
jgi:hypothetical protein